MIPVWPQNDTSLAQCISLHRQMTQMKFILVMFHMCVFGGWGCRFEDRGHSLFTGMHFLMYQLMVMWELLPSHNRTLISTHDDRNWRDYKSLFYNKLTESDVHSSLFFLQNQNFWVKPNESSFEFVPFTCIARICKHIVNLIMRFHCYSSVKRPVLNSSK